jgi:hypothetical protein
MRLIKLHNRIVNLDLLVDAEIQRSKDLEIVEVVLRFAAPQPKGVAPADWSTEPYALSLRGDHARRFLAVVEAVATEAGGGFQ